MILRYEHLSQHPNVFKSLTGLRVSEIDELVEDVLPAYREAEIQRLSRSDRQRAIGGGHPFELDDRDHLLLTVVWLRVYPTHAVLGYLFGVGEVTAGRTIKRVLPILEQAGRDTMRMPDPGKKRRRSLDDLLRDTPEIAVVIDSFEQRVQRPKDKDEADGYYSGKKKSSIPSRVRWSWMKKPHRLSIPRRVYAGQLPTSICSTNQAWYFLALPESVDINVGNLFPVDP
jgi:hypothetical protein